jgi:hypothetical protein
MAILAGCEVSLAFGNRVLRSAIEATLLGAGSEDVKAHERSYDQDHQKEEAESADDTDLSPCPLPCLALLAKLNLKHHAKFLRFLLAETI